MILLHKQYNQKPIQLQRSYKNRQTPDKRQGLIRIYTFVCSMENQGGRQSLCEGLTARHLMTSVPYGIVSQKYAHPPLSGQVMFHAFPLGFPFRTTANKIPCKAQCVCNILQFFQCSGLLLQSLSQGYGASGSHLTVVEAAVVNVYTE